MRISERLQFAPLSRRTSVGATSQKRRLMDNTSDLNTDNTFDAAAPVVQEMRGVSSWLRPYSGSKSVFRPGLIANGFADQALSVGGVFLANVALARTRTIEEYGMFALSYSLFTFLAGLHNAVILEPFTIYGSGRYRDRFSKYLRLTVRSNLVVCVLLSGTILLICLLLSWAAPRLASRALIGLGLTIGVLLSGVLLRRAFYVERQPALAAQSSLTFFITVSLGLGLALTLHLLDSLSVFLILALGWIVAGASYGRKLFSGKTAETFLESEPGYWSTHWEYTRWVLLTAFVFQLMTQGYYWLVAAFLSVNEVGDLKAIYNLIAPVDQVFAAFGYLMLPAMASHYATKQIGSLFSLWRLFAVTMLGVSVSFALGLRIVGRGVLHVLYGGKFDGLAPLLFILALLPIVMTIGHTINNALKAVERPKFVFFAYVCSGATTFLGGIPLVIYFGLRGAVYGMLLSGTAYTATLALGFFLIVHRKSSRLSQP